MVMDVVDALLLLVVVGFQLFSERKKSGLTVELARVATREIQDTWLGDFGEDRVNKLLLENAEPDGQLCAHLDTIELDENLQFLRLSADYCGRPSREVIKYRCQLANESEGFYRCRLVSNRGDPSKSQLPCGGVQDQWLYTIIQPQQQKPDIMEIHSNVVPRQAYLKRLKGTISTCREHELCTGGFSRISVLREGEPYHLSCTNCALGDQLKLETAHVDAEVVKLLDLGETDVKDVEDHPVLGGGRDGEVAKIYWRKGVFARKTFSSPGPNFDSELEIAKEVSHPNIVHCFGVSLWSPVDQPSAVSLYMELLEESLEHRIQEPIQEACPFSFQDILDILLQVASAMKQLHDKNFIHGDLKPCNILLSRLRMPHSKSGTFYLAKVADFGCVQRVPPGGFANPKSADGKSNAPASFRSNIGTREYTAPEVFRHRVDKIPPKHPKMIDVYSFGVVAYQMLTGVAILYEEYGDYPTRLKARVIEGTLRPNTGFDIGTLDRDRKSLFTSLVEKCWVSDPESRLSFSDICDILTSKHEENRAHSLEHGGNGAYSIEQGAHGSSLCSGDVSKSDNSKEFKDKYV